MKLVPDVEGKRAELFAQFLSQPETLQQLKNIVETVKKSRSGGLPDSELSLIPTVKRKSPLPPKSPLISPRSTTHQGTPKILDGSPSLSARYESPILTSNIDSQHHQGLNRSVLSSTKCSPHLSCESDQSLPLQLSDVYAPNHKVTGNTVSRQDEQTPYRISTKSRQHCLQISKVAEGQDGSFNKNEAVNNSDAAEKHAEDRINGNDESNPLNAIDHEVFRDISVSDFEEENRNNKSSVSEKSLSNQKYVTVRKRTSKSRDSSAEINSSHNDKEGNKKAQENLCIDDLTQKLSEVCLSDQIDPDTSNEERNGDHIRDTQSPDDNSVEKESWESVEGENVKRVFLHAECNSDCDHTVQQASYEEIPKFYPYPGKLAVLPSSLIISIQKFFSKHGGILDIDCCGELCPIIGLHSYLRTALFAALGKSADQTFTCAQFLTAYQANARYLLKEDAEMVAHHVIAGFTPMIHKHHLRPIIRDVMKTHRYFQHFLPQFEDHMLEHYQETVVASIMFAGDGWRRGTLDQWQFAKTGFIASLGEAQQAEDLTRVRHFSYDQFYIIYIRFLFLDNDTDFMLERDDLIKYDDFRILTGTLVDRIFCTNLETSPHGLMSYADFVTFVLSEIDRSSQGALHYWFNVLDIDNDGYLSLEELETFYVESVRICLFSNRDLQMASFKDICTELLDAMKATNATLCATEKTKFSCHELKSCHIFPHIIEAFINVLKFVEADDAQHIKRHPMQVWNDYLDRAMITIGMLLEEDDES